MKKLIFSLLIVVSIICCCASNSGGSSSSNVSDFKSKDWKLVEVLIDNRNINFNRKGFGKRKSRRYFYFEI